MKEDKTYYLREGEQTKIDNEVKTIATNMVGTTVERAKLIIDYMKNFEYIGFKETIFRRRTASQIIIERTLCGCSDASLAFIVVARACGIPAKYIETIDSGWLAEGGYPIMGHIYAKIFNEVDNSWIWVDPMQRTVGISPEEKGRVFFKEGLDSWDIGIRSFDDLKRQFNEFREEYSASHLSL